MKEGITIVFFNTVVSIGKEAFMNCDSLRTITIPEGVEEIGESAFHGCSKLEKVIIPESIKKYWTKRIQKVVKWSLSIINLQRILRNKKGTLLINCGPRETDNFELFSEALG